MRCTYFRSPTRGEASNYEDVYHLSFITIWFFIFFFSFPALFGTLHNHIKSRADLYSFLGSRSLPGQIEMMARGYCKKAEIEETCAIKLSALPFRSQDGRLRLDTSVITFDIQDASWVGLCVPEHYQ